VEALMSGTTSRGYPYPTAGDNFVPSSDFQGLATAVDTDVAAIVAALGTWTTYTPTLYKTIDSSGSKVAIAGTVNFAEYIKLGKMCIVHVDITAGAASTHGVGISLPFAAAEVWISAGSGQVQGSSTASTARISNDLSSIAFYSPGSAYVDVASGAVVAATIVYRTV
jgi:hypothetical protein